MNLISNAWIPVSLINGESRIVSLEECFTQASGIADLSLTPPERIAVTNLLLCIAHRALNGPQDGDDHESCRDRIVPESAAYLGRTDIRSCFELLGSGPRFLQIHGAGNPGTASLAKLAGADEKSASLFQPDLHAFRSFTPEWAALRLLSFQNYAAGGKVGGSETIGGKTTPVSAKAGPRRDSNAIHGYLRGETLLETLWLNLIPFSDLAAEPGEPVWEILQSLPSPEVHHIAGKPVAGVLTTSYLGRLVPLSRSIWLDEGLATTELTKALDYPGFAEGARDSSLTILTTTKNNQPEHVPLSCAKGGMLQEAWRSLGAVLLIRATTSDPQTRGPFVISNAAGLPHANGMMDLWLGGVGGDQANTIDYYESSYRIPRSVFIDDGVNRDWRDAFEAGVKLADASANRLEAKVGAWCRICDPHGSSDRKRLATDHYWSVLQQHHHVLVEEANKASTSPSRSLDDRATAPWPRFVKQVTKQAFGTCCPLSNRAHIRARAFIESGRKLPQPERRKTKNKS